jgi:adenylate cyclase
MNKKPLQKILVGILLGLVSTLFIITLTNWFWPKLFDAFENKSLDWRYKARLEKLHGDRHGATIDDIIIIDIDNRSLNKLGRFDNWPRRYHAKIIDYLSSGGALAIGFDILFMEPDKDQEQDNQLITSTANANNVYHSMAFSKTDSNAFLYRMVSPPVGFKAKNYSIKLAPNSTQNLTTADRMDGKILDLYNVSTGIGFANFYPDNDGVIRKMPLFLNFGDRQYMGLSFSMVTGILNATAENISIVPGKEIQVRPPGGEKNIVFNIPIDKSGNVLINYLGTFQTFRYVSYYDVLVQRIPAETFKGRIVLVGTSAAGLSDIRPVPFQDAFPGVEIHANIIHNILTQDFITRHTLFYTILNLFLLGIAIALLAMLLKPWQSALFAIPISGGYALLANFLFVTDAYWLEFVRPILTIFFAYLFVFVYRYIDEERSKRYIKNIFQYYQSKAVVDELLKNPDMLKLGGERRIATAFFSDIKSFTAVSEELSPEELVLQLNEYLSAMTKIVLKYEGYLDKYEGDAIMAIFGVPLEQPNHAERACLASLEMQQEMVNLRTKWEKENKPQFHIRIGVNTGPMIAGNIGGVERVDYTVIGDAVNLASRLEGANKQYKTNIMISEFTKELLPEDFVLRELDLIRVQGKTQPVRIFQVVAKSRSELTNDWLNILDQYKQGLSHYRKQNWNAAITAFDRALLINNSDGPSNTYIKRCLNFKKNPVPPNWDGVYEMTTK